MRLFIDCHICGKDADKGLMTCSHGRHFCKDHSMGVSRRDRMRPEFRLRKVEGKECFVCGNRKKTCPDVCYGFYKIPTLTDRSYLRDGGKVETYMPVCCKHPRDEILHRIMTKSLYGYILCMDDVFRHKSYCMRCLLCGFFDQTKNIQKFIDRNITYFCTKCRAEP